MTYEEYLKLPRMPNPYFYFIYKNGMYLYYLGSHHCFDPQNSVIGVIKHYWNDFLSQAKGAPTISFIEGGTRHTYNSEEECILKSGEAGLITYLSHLNNIECSSPEPSFEYETNELLRGFSKDEILTYYFTRNVSQWNRLVNKPDFEKYTTESLENYKKTLGWDDIDYSVKERIAVFEKLTGHKFIESDYELMTTFDNPMSTDNVVNRVSRASSILRDGYIVSRIKDEWDRGKNIFVIYGKTHAIMQEPVIRSM